MGSTSYLLQNTEFYIALLEVNRDEYDKIKEWLSATSTSGIQINGNLLDRIKIIASTIRPFNVYNDMGLPQGDIWVWSGKDWGLPAPKLIEGDYINENPPEGKRCFAITSSSGHKNYVGWGVFLGIFNKNHELIEPHTIDLSPSRQLEFWVKTPVNLKVEIQQSNSNGRKSSPLYISNFGWNEKNSNRFQGIVIPISRFDGNKSNIFAHL